MASQSTQRTGSRRISDHVTPRIGEPLPAVQLELLTDATAVLAGTVAEVSLGAARSAAYQVAVSWWSHVVGPARLARGDVQAACYDGPLLSLNGDGLRVAATVGMNLAALPVAEASFAIGKLYCSLLPSKHRSANGIFYTPAPLVGRLLDNAEAAGHDWTLGRVIDPSCGGGAFMVEAARRMRHVLGDADPAIVVASIGARLRGWDLDPFAAWLSHVSVEAVLLTDIVASGRRLPPVTEARDSLAGFAGYAGRYALVMGNPAFGKIKDDEDLRRRFRRSLFGHPNLYGLFTDLAVHLAARQNGIIAYLTPASYLGGQYFKALRRLLTEHAPPVSIDIVESRQDVFEDVLQEVALSVFRRGAGSVRARCAVIHAEALALRIEPAGELTLPSDPEAAWVMPRRACDAPFVSRMQAMPGRLRDWGYAVSTGPLVWNRKKDRLHHVRKSGYVPIVWAEAVCANGIFRLSPEKRNHAAWYRPAGPNDPNLVTRPSLLIQRTTSKEQSRRLVTACLSAEVIESYGAVTVENHLNMVLPTSPSPAVPLEAVAAFFASGTADRIIRCINASVALSASEIEAMPLPPAAAVLAAMASPDPDAALCGLYGIAG